MSGLLLGLGGVSALAAALGVHELQAWLERWEYERHA